MRPITGLFDGRHQLFGRDLVAVLDAGLLGSEVDRRGHPVKFVEFLLDSMCTRRARHAVNRELYGRHLLCGLHRLASWEPASSTAFLTATMSTGPSLSMIAVPLLRSTSTALTPGMLP